MQPRTPAHPAPDVLAAFGLGKLNEHDTLTIAKHLEACTRCCQAVEQAGPDSFIGRVRAAKPAGSGTQLPAGLANPFPAKPPMLPSTPLPTANGSPPADLPPELANHPKFLILSELGRGGMGVVYKAQHRFMDILVALKVINKSLLDNPGALERFDREVRAAAKLDHPHIVRALDADRAGELRILVMDFVEGANLQDVLDQKGPLPIPHACHYIRQAALGLQYAHEQGMVHRDIKPQNLILTPRGQVKILDFGLARLVSERKATGGLTKLGDFMGTPHYMAPEQAMDARKADIRADLYSLACTLYSLLTGNPPFHEDTVVKLVMAHMEKEAPSLDALRSDVPRELAEVMRRMLAKDPAHRFQTPVEVAQALAPFCKAGPKTGSRPEVKPAPRSALATKETVSRSDTSQFPSLKPSVIAKAAPPFAIPLLPAEEASPFAQISHAIPSSRKKRRNQGQPSGEKKKWMILAGVVATVLLFGMAALWFGGMLFKVKTSEGLLVVAVNEPNAEISIDGEKVGVTWDEGGKKAEIQVKVGKHKIEVKKDGFKTVGTEVTLEKGGRESFSVSLIVAAAPAPPPQAITTGNAKDLHPVGEVSADVREVVWGPKRGELSLLSWKKPANVVDATTYKTLRQVGEGKELIHLAYGSDGDKIAWCENDTKVEINDVKAKKKLVLDTGNQQPRLVFSPDGKLLATGGYDTKAMVWDTGTGKMVRSFDMGQITGGLTVTFSPDGRKIAVGNRNSTTRLFDVATGKLLHELPRNMTHELKFSPDGKTLAVAYVNGEVGLWDVSSGELLRSAKTGAEQTYTVDWSLKGDVLATAGLKGKITLWKAADLTILHALDAPEWVIRVRFSPDGTNLVSSGGGRLQVGERKVIFWGLREK